MKIKQYICKFEALKFIINFEFEIEKLGQFCAFALEKFLSFYTK